MAKVSVIIPVYNVEKYAAQCLDSVIHQTMRDLEIICVDDGSTDSSGAILDSYARMDSRIKVIHKQNTGYGHTMNVGMDSAESEYIAVIESDDFAEPDMLELLYAAAVKSDADIAKANHYNFREGQDNFCDWLEEFPKERVIDSREYPTILYKANTIWTCLYKRKFLLENQIRFHETPGASFQDISFALQGWLLAKRVYLIGAAVLHYRNDNPDSSMHNPDKIFNVFDEYGWLEEKFANFWRDNSLLESYFVAAKYRDYFSHYHRIADHFQYAFLLRFEEEVKADMEKGRIKEAVFSQAYWRQLCLIAENKNLYFSSTAKNWSNPKLSLCDFGNETAYLHLFIDALRKYPQIVIYGAGKVGEWLAEKLSEREVSITCFAVTKKEDNICRGIPVKELEELEDIVYSCAVIVAVAEDRQYELYQNLKKHRFKNIFRVDKLLKRL